MSGDPCPMLTRVEQIHALTGIEISLDVRPARLVEVARFNAEVSGMRAAWT